MTVSAPTPQPTVPAGPTFWGHPRGLATLFFTEFWERFSFYGLKAMLLLFMTATLEKGGLSFTTSQGSSIFGVYASLIYLASLPGGWVADRLLGQRRSVLLGGCLIAAGQFTLAVPGTTFLFLGLLLNVAGTGLLKPNASTMVGELYPSGTPEAGARRDAGFSIFYMGINLGAFVSPLISGWLGERVDWHLGFACGGVGMLVGVAWYLHGSRYLGEAGLRPNAHVDPVTRRRTLVGVVVAVVAMVLAVVAMANGVFTISPETAARGIGVLIVCIAIAYFTYQIVWGSLDASEKRRMSLIFVLFVFASLFWSGFEQAPTSLNLFARDLTDRHLFGWDVPVTTLQAVNPAFIILFSPVFAVLWQKLGRRNPSSPTKFSLGLIFLGCGFLALSFASTLAIGHSIMGPGIVPRPVSMGWLCLTYLLFTFGELCLSPVGLSTVTKLAPHRKVSQMMGIWFMSIALGEVGAALVAGTYEKLPLYATFGSVAATTIGAGILLLLMSRPLRRLLGAES
jgi:POT family proton-dependent oligopeptide transporter